MACISCILTATVQHSPQDTGSLGPQSSVLESSFHSLPKFWHRSKFMVTSVVTVKASGWTLAIWVPQHLSSSYIQLLSIFLSCSFFTSRKVYNNSKSDSISFFYSHPRMQDWEWYVKVLSQMHSSTFSVQAPSSIFCAWLWVPMSACLGQYSRWN